MILCLSSQSINPEHAEVLARKNQKNRPPLVLSMSIDNQKNSPGLKRRLSKERLQVPKLDMQKEREDMMHSLERLGEEPQENSATTASSSTTTSSSSVTSGSNATSSSNTSSSRGESHEEVTSAPSQPQESTQGSPKTAKRMSTKMLAKVSMWEQASNSPPSPRTSTPINSPQVNGPSEQLSKWC